MSELRMCAHCSGNNLQVGNLWMKGEPRFRPESMTFLTLSSGAHTTVTACMDCGALAFWADPEEIRSLVKEGE